jgi:hypothetical protein
MDFNDIALNAMKALSASSFRVFRMAPRAAMAAVLLTMACGLGGCAGGAANNSFAMASNSASGPTIAFESIDGPPPQVFDRMVNVLDSESKLRSLSIVSREGTAAYRVRGYLAAEINHGRTTIAWVWDVYDQNQQRALRLSGEEPAGKAGRDAWTAADDLVLRKIAQAGLSGLAGMINGTSPADALQPAPPPTPSRRGPAVASADDQPAPREGEFAVGALGYTGGPIPAFASR